MSNDENDLVHRSEIRPYPLFCFDSNKNSPGIPESKLKLKPKPKLKVELNKEFINQGFCIKTKTLFLIHLFEIH